MNDEDFQTFRTNQNIELVSLTPVTYFIPLAFYELVYEFVVLVVFAAVLTWKCESSSSFSSPGSEDGSGVQPVHVTVCVDECGKPFP